MKGLHSRLLSFRRHSAVRRFGRRLEQISKQGLLRLFLVLCRVPAAVDPARLEGVRKILLLRPNFRIGNTLISLPLIDVLRSRFPGAQLDYLGADTTVVLLKGQPLDRIDVMSRHYIYKPWLYLGLLNRLRRRRYDLVLQAGNGSFSGMICMALMGARYRMGAGKWAEGICNLRVDMGDSRHAYDDPMTMARQLGVPCRDHPAYQTTTAERDQARGCLQRAGFGEKDAIHPFVALFVGGHAHKRWPSADWVQLIRQLLDDAAWVLVLIGPEEAALSKVIRAAFSHPRLCVMDPLPLRDFAAVLGFARLVVTPDTGPMHLAVALDVPTVAIMQNPVSLQYAPRGEMDRTLFRPENGLVYDTLVQHPAWNTVIAGGSSGGTHASFVPA